MRDLDRVERLDPRLNAVGTLDAERARDEAAARGEPLDPLHGLPITVKDSIETAGLRGVRAAAERGVVPTRGHVPPPRGTLGDLDMAVLGPIGGPRRQGRRPARRFPAAAGLLT